MSGYDFIIDDRVPVVVYDVSIVDLEERIRKAKSYETMKKTCQELHVTHKALSAAIKGRKRIYSPVLQKEVAVRYKKQST